MLPTDSLLYGNSYPYLSSRNIYYPNTAPKEPAFNLLVRLYKVVY